MRLESELVDSVARFLLDLGYPEDSIVPEPRIESRSGQRVYRPDFLLVDPKRGERLAIVEVKTQLRKQNRGNIEDQLTAYAHAAAEQRIEAFLITSVPETNRLAFHRLNPDGGLDDLAANEFPRFAALVASHLASRKESVEDRQDDAADSLRKVSRRSAFVVGLVLLLDVLLAQWSIEVLTAERLALVALIAFLALVPYAAKLKVLGLEWERYNMPPRKDP